MLNENEVSAKLRAARKGAREKVEAARRFRENPETVAALVRAKLAQASEAARRRERNRATPAESARLSDARQLPLAL